ncbi:MAG: hypothetical protein COT91_02770 [Candidatus Doudnabacteria bacterium CG10_big_fil_rev_8_21_14_0_10_41_10]|uniref:LamG-like jellyroll fold domain-containing protein n=1 Tax=Candidatus Doudnabacteria bacterium CG10_big_fil_rev_8_21_14_0_10_41_10 TaxID=1974551 RepID=A0A2H0VFP7_9BACT|nr:MAG: hypothetical protein COT91_02770 [Candidatus Doudnabacteria bacterium CG10_big_fil_rev_8_21_14_0_10_41_10]
MSKTFSTTGNISHFASVSGLSDGVAYAYYVRCRDLAGNTNASDYSINFAVSAPSIPPPPPSNAVYQYYEAESGSLISPMAVASDTGASEGKYIASSAVDSGTASYGFSAPAAGSYVVWMRLLGPSISQDSIYVSMDGTSEDVFDMAENKWSPNWQWVKVNGRAGIGNPLTLNPKLFSLTAGSHTLKIRGREVGSKIDKILVTNDQGFVPTDGSSQPTTPPTSGDTQAPSAAVQQPTAGQIVSGTIDLKATATDNEKVISLYFLIDGVKFGSNYRLPLPGNSYMESFDSHLVADGAHTVAVRAEDEAGNVTITPPVSFTVKNSTTAPPTVNQKPTGFLDGVKTEGIIYGWAKDSDNDSLPVKVHIFIDKNAGTAGASPVEIIASESRSDVGNHAFNYAIPETYRNNASHQVWVWAIDLTDTTGSSNVMLTGSPKSFTLQPSSTPPPPTTPPPSGQTSGVAAHWTFDSSDITGNSLADKSGNNRPLTLTSIGQGSGKYSQAGSFNGSSSFGNVANTSVLDLSSDLTLSAWVKTTNTNRTETVVGKYYLGGYESGYLLRVNADGHLGLRLGGDNLSNIYSTSNREVTDTGKVVNDGQWHHVVAVIKLGQGVTFYIDGSQTSNHQRAVVASSNSAVLSVGRTASNDYGYGAHFTGDIDEVKIYTSALSASDVAAMYGISSPVPPDQTPPPTTTPPPTGQTSGYFEAESGSLTSPMAKGSDTAVSGGQYVYTPTTDAGSLSLPISVTEAGNYYIWGRILSPNYTRDSFRVSVGSGAGDIWDTAEGLWSDSWQWTRITGRNANGGVVSSKNQNPRVFSLSAGNQTLVFEGRDANTFLDRIFITKDPSAVPSQTVTLASPSASSPDILTDVKNEEPVANPLPVPVTVNSENLRFGPGTLLKGSDSSVWLVLDNGSRYGFDDTQEFFHFGYRFDLVHAVTDEELNAYPISTIDKLQYHATNNFIKYQNDPTIYMVENNIKRGVTSPEVFFTYVGSWDEVLIIPDDLTYETGASLSFPDGTIIKGSGPTVYIVENGKKRALRSAEAFFNLGHDFSQVLLIPDSDLNLNELGEEVG